MGCASSIHISDRVVYHSGKESEDSHSPQQTNTTQHQGNPASGLPLKPPSSKVRQPAFITLTQVCVFQCVCVVCKAADLTPNIIFTKCISHVLKVHYVFVCLFFGRTHICYYYYYCYFSITEQTSCSQRKVPSTELCLKPEVSL